MTDAAAPLPREGLLARFRAFNFSTLRALLHLWIRPRVINADADKLSLDTASPICYVLPSRSLADLLVVDHACEKAGLPRPHDPLAPGNTDEARSFFFLAHVEGRWFTRSSYRSHSSRMLRLLAAHAEDSSLSVQVVPVSLFWGHAPERERSLIKLLLSDTWTATRRIKKFLALMFQPSHIFVQFSAPISLRGLVDGEPDEARRVRKLARILRVHFRLRKQAIIGPDLSHRRTMVGAIVSSSAVQSAIDAEVSNAGITRSAAEALARRHANEIAADQSYRVIRFLYLLLTWFWHRLYRGFTVKGIEAAQELAQTHEVVYVPCHRSHIDYLILSYLLYINGLPPPHIAAGKNMNIPLIGPFLRRGGAFFMRRSFQDDQLYKAVFDEYLHMTFTKGYSVEYFVEGGRSRTGRMLSPRMGLIGMTVRSFQRKPSPPLVFVPVYFGYERVLEAATYIGELRGAAKRDESIFDLLRVFRFLHLEFGKVHVNFGQPIELSDFLDREFPGWESDGGSDREALFEACRRLGDRIAVNINRAAAVTPVNLLAVILLATSKQRISESSLKSQIELFRRLLRDARYSDEMTVTDLPVADIIAYGEQLSLLERMDPPFADVLVAEGDRPVLLTYYRNNVAHLLVIPSLLVRILTHREGLSMEELIASCCALYPYLEREYFLRWPIDEVAALCAHHIDCLRAAGLVTLAGERVQPAPRGSDEYTGLLLLGEVVEPSLQRFFIAAGLIDACTEHSVTQVTLEQCCRQVAQTIAAIYRFNAPEFFQESLFTTFLSGLIERAAVSVDGEKLSATASLRQILRAIDPLLDRDIRQGIHETVTHCAADIHRSGSTFPSA